MPNKYKSQENVILQWKKVVAGTRIADIDKFVILVEEKTKGKFSDVFMYSYYESAIKVKTRNLRALSHANTGKAQLSLLICASQLHDILVKEYQMKPKEYAKILRAIGNNLIKNNRTDILTKPLLNNLIDCETWLTIEEQ